MRVDRKTVYYVDTAEASNLQNGRPRIASGTNTVYVVRCSGGPRGTGRELARFTVQEHAYRYIDCIERAFGLVSRWD